MYETEKKITLRNECLEDFRKIKGSHLAVKSPHALSFKILKAVVQGGGYFITCFHFSVLFLKRVKDKTKLVIARRLIALSLVCLFMCLLKSPANLLKFRFKVSGGRSQFCNRK